MNSVNLQFCGYTYAKQFCPLKFQQAAYSKKSTYSNTLITNLEIVFEVNPVNLQFCGYAGVKTTSTWHLDP